jgi:hypothetical protein
MDNFEIIESVKNISQKEIYYQPELENNMGKCTNGQVAPLSKQAQKIMDTSNAQWKEYYMDLFNKADISNSIVEGREVIVSNKMITRSYNLFAELMGERVITPVNINLAIVYACNVSNCEYIKTWQDKQMLVLLLLRMYIANNIDVNNIDGIYLMIESHIPIIVEKVLHSARRRSCWRCFLSCGRCFLSCLQYRF